MRALLGGMRRSKRPTILFLRAATLDTPALPRALALKRSASDGTGYVRSERLSGSACAHVAVHACMHVDVMLPA